MDLDRMIFYNIFKSLIKLLKNEMFQAMKLNKNVALDDGKKTFR